MHMLQIPSFFGISKAGTARGLLLSCLSSITPLGLLDSCGNGAYLARKLPELSQCHAISLIGGSSRGKSWGMTSLNSSNMDCTSSCNSAGGVTSFSIPTNTKTTPLSSNSVEKCANERKLAL